jgi:REP element-mobilizing transposase RayT
MGRKNRIEFPGAFYHVISRGNNKQSVYYGEDDYKYFLESLKALKARDKFKLYGYVLMGNHFHLLIETGETKLSRTMQGLLTRYARYFNRKHNKIGHLFQGRYKAILCQKEAYLLELVRYIQMNPVRAGIVKKVSEWSWSSHQNYLGRSDMGFVDTELILSIMGKSILTARRNYSEFVNKGLNEGHRKDYYPVEDCIGDGKYFRELQEQRGEIRRDEKKRIRVKLKDLAEVVCKMCGIGTNELKSYKKTKDVVSARRIFIYIGIRSCGYSGTETAEYLGKDKSAITHSIRHIESEIGREQAVDDKLKQILEIYK